jgi:hypothetical protein
MSSSVWSQLGPPLWLFRRSCFFSRLLYRGEDKLSNKPELFYCIMSNEESEKSTRHPFANMPLRLRSISDLPLQSPLPLTPAVISVESAPDHAVVFASDVRGAAKTWHYSFFSKRSKILLLIFVALVATSIGIAVSLCRSPDQNATPFFASDDVLPESAPHVSNKNASLHLGGTSAISVRLASDPKLGCIHVRRGTSVCRGRDWEWGNQDGGAGSIGTVLQDLSSSESDGWVEVRWNPSSKNWYRITGGYCDLRLLDTRNNFVAVGDWIYSTVTDVPVHSSSVSAHQHYLPVPSGWQIAPDNKESRDAISQYAWSTHVAVMASGVGIRTKNFAPAGQVYGDSRSKYVTDSDGWVNCPWTAYQIIIRKSTAGAPPAADNCPSCSVVPPISSPPPPPPLPSPPLGGCYEAQQGQFHCSGYESCGYTCLNGWCAYSGSRGCLCDCSICATYHSAKVYDSRTSRCIAPSPVISPPPSTLPPPPPSSSSPLFRSTTLPPPTTLPPILGAPSPTPAKSPAPLPNLDAVSESASAPANSAAAIAGCIVASVALVIIIALAAFKAIQRRRSALAPNATFELPLLCNSDWANFVSQLDVDARVFVSSSWDTSARQACGAVIHTELNPFLDREGPLVINFKSGISECGRNGGAFLWHGTGEDRILPICSGGFNPGLRGDQNGQAHGQGEYFGRFPSTSHSYARENANGMRRLLLCYVLKQTAVAGSDIVVVDNPPLCTSKTYVLPVLLVTYCAHALNPPLNCEYTSPFGSHRIMYHQTSDTAANSIMQEGFDMSKAASNVLAGAAIYFATHPKSTLHKARHTGCIIRATVNIGMSLPTGWHPGPIDYEQTLRPYGYLSVRIPRHDWNGSPTENGAEYVVYKSVQVQPHAIMQSAQYRLVASGSCAI